MGRIYSISGRNKGNRGRWLVVITFLTPQVVSTHFLEWNYKFIEKKEPSRLLFLLEKGIQYNGKNILADISIKEKNRVSKVMLRKI